jgi:hypothetical protein
VFWSPKKKPSHENPKLELIYSWSGISRVGRHGRTYRPYIRVIAIRERDIELLDLASRRGGIARAIVERNIFGAAAQTSLDPWFSKAREVWDELLPFPRERFTHLVECGIKYSDIKARSHFLKVPLGLEHGRFTADFCAAEIAGFLTSVLNNDFYDFDGAALETQQMWILNCIFAKWKNLRDR